MGMKDFKKVAFMGASRVAMNPSVLRVLSNPSVQKAFIRMINANADVQDWLAGQMQTIAKNMSLATREEVGKLKRSLRDQNAELEIMADRVAELSAKLDKMEKGMAQRTKPAPRKVAKAPAKKAPTKVAKAPAKKKASTTKSAAKTKTRATKKKASR